MVFQLILSPNFTTSRLNRIGRQLQQVELAASELAVNWRTTSARFNLISFDCKIVQDSDALQRIPSLNMPRLVPKIDCCISS